MFVDLNTTPAAIVVFKCFTNVHGKKQVIVSSYTNPTPSAVVLWGCGTGNTA